MVVNRYFYVQELAFKLCGVDTKARKPQLILKHSHLFVVPLIFAITHDAAAIHYACTNRHDYVEFTDSLSLVCQSVLSLSKWCSFLVRRRQFIEIIKDIHLENFKAAPKELPIIKAENKIDVKLSTLYFRLIVFSVISAFGNPIIEALYGYYKTGELVLRVPYKASYFWDYTQLSGYALACIWCALSIFSLVTITLAVDTTFVWLVSNIVAQLQVLAFRFKATAEVCRNTPTGESTEILKSIKEGVARHNQILQLIKRLNRIYGELIFFKFLISCTQICFLAFRLSRHNASLIAAVYPLVFLLSVALQLMLYCYNGQRIRDESLQLANEIYFAFDWHCLAKTYKKLLLQMITCAQRSTELKGVFFVLDLNLFVWVFKTAGSFIAALKSLEEEA